MTVIGRSATYAASSAVSITPSDTEDVDDRVRGLYVGAAGDIRAVLQGDENAVTFVALAAGLIHPLRVKRVMATGTTATGILGVW